jgi:hypothetical protein
MTSPKTLITLSTDIELGVLTGASAAQASNENHGGNETGVECCPPSKSSTASQVATGQMTHQCSPGV